MCNILHSPQSDAFTVQEYKGPRKNGIKHACPFWPTMTGQASVAYSVL